MATKAKYATSDRPCATSGCENRARVGGTRCGRCYGLSQKWHKPAAEDVRRENAEALAADNAVLVAWAKATPGRRLWAWGPAA